MVANPAAETKNGREMRLHGRKPMLHQHGEAVQGSDVLRQVVAERQQTHYCGDGLFQRDVVRGSHYHPGHRGTGVIAYARLQQARVVSRQ